MEANNNQAHVCLLPRDSGQRVERPDWRGERPDWRGERPDWRGERPDWRGDRETRLKG